MWHREKLKPEQQAAFDAYLLAPPPDAVRAGRPVAAQQDAAAIEEFNAAEG